MKKKTNGNGAGRPKKYTQAEVNQMLEETSDRAYHDGFDDAFEKIIGLFDLVKSWRKE